MKHQASITVASLLLLTACGSTGNSDTAAIRPIGLERQTIAPVADVQVVVDGPAAASDQQKVIGTSCKNKLWDPEPSRDNAVNLMLRQAKERGFNTVHSVNVAADPNPVLKNCWAALNATGVAFNR